MSKQFSALGISEPILKSLSDLNISEPIEIQNKTIPVLLSKNDDFVGLAKTGTGKTAAFVLPALHRLCTTKITNKASVLVLTPEISLTPQLVRSFEELFGNQVITVHSNLSDVERRDAWLSVLHASRPVDATTPLAGVMPAARCGTLDGSGSPAAGGFAIIRSK